MSSTFMEVPGGGLGIFTDRDQLSIFLSFEFRKSVFFWVLLTAAVFFWAFIFKCSIFLTVFFWGPVLCTWYFCNHGSPLLSCRT